jgi:DNA helicase-2/ATP-dependent DNA helicase PcrA
LEFPVVFIAGVEEGLLPISRAIEAEWKSPEAIEEERRLFYVGITRAKQLLFITYAGGRTLYGGYMPSVASRFLASLPQQHVKTIAARPTRLTPGGRPLVELARGGSGAPPRPAVAPAPSPAPALTFAAGDRVFHARFGEGLVAEVADRRGDQELAIDFARHGRKRLLGSLANLEPLE